MEPQIAEPQLEPTKIPTRKRVPFIEQLQQTECGLCCMAMVVGYYKSYISLYELRERMGNGRDGTTLYHLRNLAEQLGFESKCYSTNVSRLHELPMPSILFWEGKHFVVLEKITPKYFYIVDPALGRRKLTTEQMEASFSGYILTSVPQRMLEPKKQKSVWPNFLRLLLQIPKLFAIIAVISTILQIFTVGMPILIQVVIDRVIISFDQDLLKTVLMGIVLLVVFQTLFSYFRGRLIITLQNYLDYELMTRFFSHLLKLPYQFFQVRSFGDLLFRAGSLRVVRDMLTGQLIKGVLDIGLMFFFTLYMLFQSPLLTLWVVLFASINIIILFFSRPRIAEANQEEVIKHSTVQGSQTEILYGIFGVKTAGVENMMYNRWSNQFKELIQAYRKKELVLNVVGTATLTLTLFSPLFIIWLGAQQVFAGYLTLGALIAFHTVTVQYFGLSSSLVGTVNSIILASSYLRRIQDVLDAPPEHTSDNPVVLEKLKGDIELKDVSFSYTKYSKPVIQGISLKINPGEKVALVGKSGSGKSTLARLMLGLYEPSSGTIHYDGHDLRDLDRSILRKKIGVVPQDVTLLNRSIMENITIHNPDASREEVEEAAKIARIHDEIMQMPMNYQTVISEMGMNISGGQRQRIAMARALLHKPSILVLDEATSSLDHVNEEQIDNYLTEMKCTRVVVAHRLTTIMNSNLIIVLDDGKIVEQGKHEQLLKNKGYYYKFYEKYGSLDE